MKELKQDIKSGGFKKLYVFYGEEKYLVQDYEKKLKRAVLQPGMEDLNLTVFQGNKIQPQALVDAWETLPFMAEKRFVLIKGSGLFVSGRKEDSDKLAAELPDIPETTVVLFVEDTVDKRGKLYKAANKLGKCLEFSPLKEKDLQIWMERMAEQRKLEISPSLSSVLIRNVSGNMAGIIQELDKLEAYKQGGGVVGAEDLNAVSSKSLEAKIFDLVDAIGIQNPYDALDIYRQLILMKESPIMVLSMIGRQFRLLLRCAVMKARGCNTGEIAQKSGLRGFLVNHYLRQAGNFTPQRLEEAVKDCLETDLSIKTGRIEADMGIQLLIVKYAAKRV